LDAEGVAIVAVSCRERKTCLDNDNQNTLITSKLQPKQCSIFAPVMFDRGVSSDSWKIGSPTHVVFMISRGRTNIVNEYFRIFETKLPWCCGEGNQGDHLHCRDRRGLPE